MFEPKKCHKPVSRSMHIPGEVIYSKTDLTITLRNTWWRHEMETFSAQLAICAGNSAVLGEFPVQKPVMRSFDVFFDLRLNKRLSKQSWGWWFETLPRPLWRQSNGLEGCVYRKQILHHGTKLCILSIAILQWVIFCAHHQYSSHSSQQHSSRKKTFWYPMIFQMHQTKDMRDISFLSSYHPIQSPEIPPKGNLSLNGRVSLICTIFIAKIRICAFWKGRRIVYTVSFNTSRPRQNGRHFADDTFKCIFLNENVWI